MSDSLNPFDLPPYLQAQFFLPPVVTTVRSVAIGGIICPLNPKRSVLVITSPGSIISPTASPVTGQGINIVFSSSVSYWLMVTAREHGPLCWGAWYNSGGVPADFTYFEAILTGWPDGSKITSIVDTVDTGPKRPPARIDTAPGADGKRGILDYWLSLVSRMTGSGKG